jgi:transcription antitermination factor NusG
MAEPRADWCPTREQAFHASPFTHTGSLLSVDCAMHQLNQGLQMSLQTISQTFGDQVSLNSTITGSARDRNWYAVYTVPQHEKSALKHLDLREIESFLPVYETVRVWKNRQRMKLSLPLFPTYLFVHINFRERAKVLQSPGVLQIVGNRGCAYIPDSEVELLRSGCSRQKIEPYRDLVIGEKVRIKSGVMQGLQGTLVRKSNSMRFVLTIELINQHAAIQVDAEDLEQIVA